MARMLLLIAAEEQRQEKILMLRRRQLQENIIPMLLPEKTFSETFGLGKDQFMVLCDDLIPLLHPSRRTSAIKPEIKILAALQFYASGSYQKSIGDSSNLLLSQTSVSDCLAEVTDALNNRQILRKYISLPRSANERSAVAKRFFEEFGLPSVLGCVDSTHIAIIRPKSDEDAYYNRKLYYSLNVLLICDADLRILHLDASFGGACNDSYVWNLCPVKAGMQKLHEMGEIYWMLGDAGYAQRDFLMTPILNAVPGSPEEYYNHQHAKTRNVVERCFGILKTRFRCLLAHRTLHYTPEKAGKIVNACAVLYNLVNDSNFVCDDDLMVRDREQQPAYAPPSPAADVYPARQALVNTLWNARDQD